MYTLYHQDGARSTAALLTLEEGGLDYELRRVDISADEHRDPEFLALNPRGLIPALVTETGEMLGETAAIMLYLADRHRLTDLAPLPEEPVLGTWREILLAHALPVSRCRYPRTNTTAIAAYVGPVVDRYVSSLEGTLDEMQLRAPLRLMRSDGGVATPASRAAMCSRIWATSVGSVMVAMTRTWAPHRGQCVAYCITSNSLSVWLSKQRLLIVVS